MRKKVRQIPEARPVATDQLHLRFSFKHLNLDNDKFHPARCCPVEYCIKLFEILQRFSTWTVEQFIDQNNQAHRHQIDFPKTSEPDGFPNIDSEQLGYHVAWQFSVDPDIPYCHWRAHGILIDDTFFFVWLDPDHELWPDA
jgi:hypothetical protein